MSFHNISRVFCPDYSSFYSFYFQIVAGTNNINSIPSTAQIIRVASHIVNENYQGYVVIDDTNDFNLSKTKLTHEIGFESM